MFYKLLSLAFSTYVATKLNIKTPSQNLAQSFIDHVFKDKVSEPAIGSVVSCDLAAGQGDHTGIYIGKHRIVHLNGDGLIEVVSPAQFINRLGGFNTAMSIYVSCNNGVSVGSRLAAERAISMIGSRRNYGFLMDNCHQFTAGCLTGDFENSCNFFNFLKDEARESIGCTEWRIWDTDSLF
ncbi:hypothetical protein [Aeromonas veronii]|uniref:hypothetical protein n=1 Tax=Aeromonas veronii TaxID=654 RepID=UPI00244270F7|nr:hypothetical protein [Aeromonas veronii]